MPLSSDPHAWLRPYFARLRSEPAYNTLSPSHQFEQLVQAIEPEQPLRAEQMRQWTPAAQGSLLLHLSASTEQGDPVESSELWRVRKGNRELACSAHYLPTGIDLRLLEDGQFRRTQLCKDATAVAALSREWRAALIDRGWS